MLRDKKQRCRIWRLIWFNAQWTSFSRQEMQPCVPPKTRPARFPS